MQYAARDLIASRNYIQYDYNGLGAVCITCLLIGSAIASLIANSLLEARDDVKTLSDKRGKLL